ncbi:2-dehydropantoate 2-reductase [Paenibacillus sp. VCA1]|uniref:ketopantoate reductase family protein n=1 Tax=Paenibacillus sp. VCA1 TaxID=3039148 RepID=UPI0028723EF3|nr:2-dehydropantoate 2-reductase [Paenibacillus sp. VCA1]MDR9853017.1 2-dehydropantoate 2-reductase [Paenibacillus sp. VCA1]
MTIDLIGGGSLGLLYGGKLAAAGVEARIWCRTAEQAKELNSKGILIRNAAGDCCIRAVPGTFAAGTLEEFAPAWSQKPGRWMMLMTKQKDTEEACLMSAAKLLGDKQAAGNPPGVVCFQNGFGHMERLQKILPGWPLYAAVTTEGAKRTASHEVVHAGAGTTWIGAGGERLDGRNEKRLEDLAEMLQNAGFSAVLANDMDSRIYRKLLINAVINPLTALWNIRNGELLVSDVRLQAMRQLLDEALAVYDAYGIPWEEDIWDQILDVCRATADNTSSMLKDVQDGAETEVDWINGAIIALAQKAGMRAPAHELIAALVKGLSIREE